MSRAFVSFILILASTSSALAKPPCQHNTQRAPFTASSPAQPALRKGEVVSEIIPEGDVAVREEYSVHSAKRDASYRVLTYVFAGNCNGPLLFVIPSVLLKTNGGGNGKASIDYSRTYMDVVTDNYGTQFGEFWVLQEVNVDAGGNITPVEPASYASTCINVTF